MTEKEGEVGDIPKRWKTNQLLIPQEQVEQSKKINMQIEK